MLAIAFLSGTLLAIRRAKKYGIQPCEVVTLVNITIIASFVGSRMLAILENFEDYSQNPKSILFIWQGGFSYHGGLFLALIGVFWWAKRSKISFGSILDIFAPSVALGFFFVRIGCFLNGCCFGNPTDMPWGLVFPLDSPAGWIYKGIKIHPTQLYASLSGLMSFFLLLVLDEKLYLVGRNGLLFFSFLILSAVWRFIIEFFRYHGDYLQTVAWF
jgi:phosphatidylglycerol:prolipoprotein diacylglycerol transferase